jgi:hypothetical protein
MRSPTSLQENRIYGPENFRPPVQKDFCNNICHKETHALQQKPSVDRLFCANEQSDGPSLAFLLVASDLAAASPDQKTEYAAERSPMTADSEEFSYEMVEQVCHDLARLGILVDTGKRRWSERTGRYQIAWRWSPPVPLRA